MTEATKNKAPNVVPIKSKPKNKKLKPPVIPPQPVFEVTYSDIERKSALRLTERQICAQYRVSLDQWSQKIKEDQEFAWAWERGRAQATEICATVVLNAAQGGYWVPAPTKTDPSKRKWMIITSEQYNAARFWLERHAPGWLKDN